MIKVGDVCRESVSEDKEVMFIITMITDSDVIDVHMIASNGETQCLSFVDKDTMNETLEEHRIISNDSGKDWLEVASTVFTDGERTMQSI